jgi:hypothetical protein
MPRMVIVALRPRTATLAEGVNDRETVPNMPKVNSNKAVHIEYFLAFHSKCWS